MPSSIEWTDETWNPVARQLTSIEAAISSALYNYYFSLAYRDCNHCHSVTGLINRGQSNGS